jgi:hypothetical protein
LAVPRTWPSTSRRRRSNLRRPGATFFGRPALRFSTGDHTGLEPSSNGAGMSESPSRSGAGWFGQDCLQTPIRSSEIQQQESVRVVALPRLSRVSVDAPESPDRVSWPAHHRSASPEDISRQWVRMTSIRISREMPWDLKREWSSYSGSSQVMTESRVGSTSSNVIWFGVVRRGSSVLGTSFGLRGGPTRTPKSSPESSPLLTILGFDG